MAIHPVTSGQVPANERAVERVGGKLVGKEPGAGSLQQTTAQQNRQILEAQAAISLKQGDNTLALTFKAAIEAINERLAPALGEQAIERAYESGLDVSPEATAERIVSLSTALFSRYQAQHVDGTEMEQARDFVELIRGGIEQGFAEAREVLDGLGVLEGDIAANIDRTFVLVEEGLQRFLARFDAAADESASGEALTD